MWRAIPIGASREIVGANASDVPRVRPRHGGTPRRSCSSATRIPTSARSCSKISACCDSNAISSTRAIVSLVSARNSTTFSRCAHCAADCTGSNRLGHDGRRDALEASVAVPRRRRLLERVTRGSDQSTRTQRRTCSRLRHCVERVRAHVARAGARTARALAAASSAMQLATTALTRTDRTRAAECR